MGKKEKNRKTRPSTPPPRARSRSRSPVAEQACHDVCKDIWACQTPGEVLDQADGKAVLSRDAPAAALTALRRLSQLGEAVDTNDVRYKRCKRNVLSGLVPNAANLDHWLVFLQAVVRLDDVDAFVFSRVAAEVADRFSDLEDSELALWIGAFKEASKLSRDLAAVQDFFAFAGLAVAKRLDKTPKAPHLRRCLAVLCSVPPPPGEDAAAARVPLLARVVGRLAGHAETPEELAALLGASSRYATPASRELAESFLQAELQASVAAQLLGAWLQSPLARKDAAGAFDKPWVPGLFDRLSAARGAELKRVVRALSPVARSLPPLFRRRLGATLGAHLGFADATLLAQALLLGGADQLMSQPLLDAWDSELPTRVEDCSQDSWWRALDPLLQQCARQLPQLRMRGVCALLAALPPRSGLLPLTARVRPKEQLSRQECSALVASVAPHEPGAQGLVRDLCPRLGGVGWPLEQLLDVLQGCAAAMVFLEPLVREVLVRAEQEASHWKIPQTARMLEIIAGAVRCQHNDSYSDEQFMARSLVDKAPPTFESDDKWLVQFEALPIRRLFAKLAIQLLDELAGADAASLASLVWAFAAMRFLDTTLLDFVEGELKNREFTPGEVAKLLWGLAVLKRPNCLGSLVAKIKHFELSRLQARSLVRSVALAGAVQASSVVQPIVEHLMKSLLPRDHGLVYPYLLGLPGLDASVVAQAKQTWITQGGRVERRKLPWKMQIEVANTAQAIISAAQQALPSDIGAQIDVAIPGFFVAIEVERPWQCLQEPNKGAQENCPLDGLTLFWHKVLERNGWKVATVRYASWPALSDGQAAYLKYLVPNKWWTGSKGMAPEAAAAAAGIDLDEL